MGLFSCLPCCSTPLVPEDHTELSREELKRLYDRSIALNNGRLVVHGIFARANTRNNNKRVYPKHILEREVSRFEAEHIVQGTALGELDHPNYASKYFKCLNLPNISHQVLDVVWKGDQLWGTIEVLPTPSGLLLWELYSRGVKLGVSSRGWASLRSDPVSKCVFVDDDFELITFDFVTEPSTRGAYLVPVQRRYKRAVPDQAKLVATAHLGHGVVAMEKVSRVPSPAVLVQRIAELQRASALALAQLAAAGGAGGPAGPAAAGGAGGPPGAGGAAGGAAVAALPMLCGPSMLAERCPPGFKPSGLDNLLCFGHYVVHQAAPYLDREQHARDYRAHLVIFTARAHLADERVTAAGSLSRGDIDNVILNKVVTKDAFDPASTSFATRLSQPYHQHHLAAAQHQNHLLQQHPHLQLACPTGFEAGASGSSLGGVAAGGGGVLGVGVAAAAAEQGPGPGMDPGYAGVHAAAAATGGRGGGGAQSSGRGGGGKGCGPGEGDRDPWSLHPHAANSNSPGQRQESVSSEQRLGSPGSGAGVISNGHGGGLKILPVVVPAGAGPACVAGAAGAGCKGGAAEDEQALLRGWLSQVPGGESMAQGFLDIRSSLIAFAALYQMHQRRVESALVKQMGQAPVAGRA